MNIKSKIIVLSIDGKVICKKLANFLMFMHENIEFPDAVDFLSGSIVIDMGKLKDELYASEDSHELVAVEYMQKHYPSAILLIDLIPKKKRKFIH
ncbi:hypothetical protein QUO95_000903 [Enterococcus faecium]|uniref:hypothetical protein n=1 Tax=Enterococcus TaxID=1350 RepID=UPI002DD6F3E0|nr:hypothetical protein [Enterococcus faecium]